MRELAALLALALAGCHLAPAYVRPEPPTPPVYPPEYAGDTPGGERAAEIGWRDFFEDPRLEALVGAALAHNRDLAVAVARVEEARGLYLIERADRIPAVEVSGAATRSHTGTATRLLSNERTIDRFDIGVGVASFELDFWGRVRDLSEAARSEYLATVEAQRAFRLSLIREVAATYLATRESAERIQLAEATLQSRREGLRIFTARLAAGITSALDTKQVESLMTQAETELAGLRLARAQNEHLLDVLVGASIAEPLPDPLPLAQQASPLELAAGLPSELLIERPDIRAAEERLRAARADIGAARAAFFPKILLTGDAGFASADLSDLVGKDAFTWGAGPSVSFPLFNHERLRGDLRAAKAREEIALASYEKAIQTAFQEVSDALAGRRYHAERVAAQERTTQTQREIATLARARYREGVVGYLEVLDAERNLFAAEQSLVQVRRDEMENLVTLYVVLGGGSLESR